MAEYFRGDFLKTGEDCPPFSANLPIGDAETLRETLIDDFYSEVTPRREIRDENSHKIVAAKSFAHVAAFDVDTPSKFVGTVLNHYTDVDAWNLRVVDSQYLRSPDNTTPLRIEKHLFIEAHGDEVVEAYRRLLLTGTLGSLTVESIVQGISDDDPASDTMTKQKFAFTRQATTEDVVDAMDLLERTALQSKRITHLKERGARAGLGIITG